VTAVKDWVGLANYRALVDMTETDAWRFKIDGMVEKPQELGIDDLIRMKRAAGRTKDLLAAVPMIVCGREKRHRTPSAPAARRGAARADGRADRGRRGLALPRRRAAAR
jgi:hypothetical protein